jgi:hypothetical protein
MRKYSLEIMVGSLTVIGVSGYLLTANIAAKAAAKETIKQFKKVPPVINNELILDVEKVANSITQFMAVDEKAIAARILQGVMELERGAEVFLDARAN